MEDGDEEEYDDIDEERRRRRWTRRNYYVTEILYTEENILGLCILYEILKLRLNRL